MTAKTRIYMVIDKENASVALVRAYSQQQALSFIAVQAFEVKVADTETAFAYAKNGGIVRDAAKPETIDAFEPECKTPCPEEKPDTSTARDALHERNEVGLIRSTHINEVA